MHTAIFCLTKFYQALPVLKGAPFCLGAGKAFC